MHLLLFIFPVCLVEPEVCSARATITLVFARARALLLLPCGHTNQKSASGHGYCFSFVVCARGSEEASMQHYEDVI